MDNVEVLEKFFEEKVELEKLLNKYDNLEDFYEEEGGFDFAYNDGVGFLNKSNHVGVYTIKELNGNLFIVDNFDIFHWNGDKFAENVTFKQILERYKKELEKEEYKGKCPRCGTKGGEMIGKGEKFETIICKNCDTRYRVTKYIDKIESKSDLVKRMKEKLPEGVYKADLKLINGKDKLEKYVKVLVRYEGQTCKLWFDEKETGFDLNMREIISDRYYKWDSRKIRVETPLGILILKIFDKNKNLEF